jgi:hypothetical protein
MNVAKVTVIAMIQGFTLRRCGVGVVTGVIAICAAEAAMVLARAAMDARRDQSVAIEL